MNGGNQYNKKTFCVLPFLHLATHPIGTVTPCCVTDMTNDVSTAKKNGFNMFLGKDRIEDISNSESFNVLRKKMISGEVPLECKNCFLLEQNNLTSKRIESNKKFEKSIDECFENVNQDGSLKEIDYQYLELRLGSVCNLKCSTCNSFSSNRWNEDVNIFKGTKFEKFYFKNDIKTEWYRDPQFYDELFEKCNKLEEIWINGGEPTLIREHEYFLTKLIDSGLAGTISLNYSINLTSLPEHLIEKWKSFKKVTLQLSVDDLGNRNEYIRFPSKWDTIYKNLKRISKEKDIFTLELMQTVSLFNVCNINNFKKFSNDMGIYVAHNYVNYPEFLHVSLLPDEMKTEVLNNSNHLTKFELDKLKFELNKTSNTFTINDFFEYVNLLDLKRNTKITDYLHEWITYWSKIK
jgi:organic radical activating enzyme